MVSMSVSLVGADILAAPSKVACQELTCWLIISVWLHSEERQAHGLHMLTPGKQI